MSLKNQNKKQKLLVNFMLNMWHLLLAFNMIQHLKHQKENKQTNNNKITQ